MKATPQVSSSRHLKSFDRDVAQKSSLPWSTGSVEIKLGKCVYSVKFKENVLAVEWKCCSGTIADTS